MVNRLSAPRLVFALTAGVTIFFSPCVYPLLPGYVGFYVSRTDSDDASLGGAILRGVVAGVGVLGTFAALIGAAFWLGRSTLLNLTIFESLVGGLLVFFGALVVVSRAPSLSIPLPKRRSSDRRRRFIRLADREVPYESFHRFTGRLKNSKLPVR